MTDLRGMTWNHPRGYDPMVAVSAAWAREHGVTLHWDKRSLQDFESFPVEKLARDYDLIVVDHPHVGQITAEGCLHPLPDAPDIAQASVGLSYPSYRWQGRQWAYPIDAAAQVQAIRPDLIDTPPANWDAVLRLAQSGKVALPLRAPHSLMCFITLAANDGHKVRTDGPGPFVDRAGGIAALERLAALAELVDSACYGWDPIDVLGRMSRTDEIACVPLVYGYVSYARADSPGHRLSFHDIPETTRGAGVGGSALGETGIAVSAFSAAPEAAIAFARHVAGPEIQRSLYARSGGQVGHGAAWHDPVVDEAAGQFYSGTARTLEAAVLRPRHDGYMPFQDAASARIVQALTDGDFGAAVDDMDRLFARTFKPG
ncbi:multiple sugar transport system substrate-binding protein [Paracoccus isoporae]|uniref:Multiple sugar transport system substrate-binding protein n=1 Tax=Paracoccus isoporae TaxID=591205 RepID=A0A1G6XPL0_9RHOB|nr:extracellular solute-binding protein [Paracoccus isoporae]SDD79307.1 multiple sugar transport system substrate-binding protein [Paracoccus isoporae]